MSTHTPTQDTISTGLRAFLRRLTAAGWEVEAPAVSAPKDVSYCLVARPPAGEPGDAQASCLVYVYEGAREVRVDDLWRLVADTRAAECDHPVMCIGSNVELASPTRDTAARLQVRVLRLVA